MIEKLTIIGVGLIGGSLARALREAEYVREIIGYSHSVGTLQQAVDLGVIDRAEVSLSDAARGADMIVIATPIGAMPEIFTQLQSALNDQTIVTDVGSVKGDVIAAARASLGARFSHFVPGHPIAGTEQSGVAASFADLFQRRRVILTPEHDTDSVALTQVRAMWESAGAQIMTMTAEEHDRILATSSHLPHMLAYCLVDMVVRHDDYRAIMECAGGGFRDTTRIAASDAVMWRDICLANREALLDAMRQYQDDFTALIAAIEKGDGALLLQTFTRAKHVRDSLNKKL